MSVHFMSKTPEWATPQKLFDELNAEFHFTLDPCATKENAKCEKFYTKEDDGLSMSWEGERVFMNPPYGREIGKWVKKASETGGSCACCPHEPIRDGFTIMFTARQTYDFYEVV